MREAALDRKSADAEARKQADISRTLLVRGRALLAALVVSDRLQRRDGDSSTIGQGREGQFSDDQSL